MMKPAFALALVLLVGACAPKTAEPSAGHAGHGAPATALASEAPMVRLDPREEALADVKTSVVRLQPFATTVTAVGRVTVDESRLARVTAWVDGRIDRLRVAKTGAVIRRGQPIADLYSPDLVSTEQELLVAAASARELAGSQVPGVAQDARRLVAASRQRLRLWGLSDAQIDAVMRQGRPVATMPVLAPVSGVVLRRMVQSGDWVDKGMTLYEMADLSRVWVEADVYEYELAGLRAGMPVTIETVAYPGETFAGTVAFIEPVMRASSRTDTVRIELANPGGRLKPDMFVTASLRVDRGKRLVVPPDAVVDTGKRQVVWVAAHDGHFVARDVKVGAQADDGYEILSGLEDGERVAVSGGFMIDASSQLQRGGTGHQHGAGGAPKKRENGGMPDMPGM